MTPQWTFGERRRGDKVRDPLVGEFFATSAIRNLAESIVREGIQNALDAGVRADSGKFVDPVVSRASNPATMRVPGFASGMT